MKQRRDCYGTEIFAKIEDMHSTRSVAPMVSVILLVLPLFYLASYFALVKPGTEGTSVRDGVSEPVHPYCYNSGLAATVFAPLEKLDRKLRPTAWQTKFPPLLNS
ncbi:hypothetical protein NA78x_005699 [Anatilimnocola sp. NA78]|uniref:hypothetical protein n=1 Tax=Anatilimnocola sp. NA78 TaxID=3415683 RepID=UPI003CE555D4